jgi:hypothetical protein
MLLQFFKYKRSLARIDPNFYQWLITRCTLFDHVFFTLLSLEILCLSMRFMIFIYPAGGIDIRHTSIVDFEFGARVDRNDVSKSPLSPVVYVLTAYTDTVTR